MTHERLREITARYARVRVALVGDIALDRYLHIDPALAETSIETGLPVHNVVRVRPQPGAGGNVLANLAALAPAALAAVGVCGDDGEGSELRRALEGLGVDLRRFLVRADRPTFTYTKPILDRPGWPPEELSRLDIRPRTPTPPDLEDAIIARLRAAAAEADVVVALDQVPEPACGVLTRRVKAAVADFARQHPGKVFVADSRTSIGDFAAVRIKVNRMELARRFGVAPDALAPGLDDAPSDAVSVAALARRWSQELGREVFVTLGEQGILAADGETVAHVPGIAVEPPVDVTGAGDAALAHLALALAAGATAAEAAELANAAGAVVVRKLGTTGTATVDEVAHLLESVG